MSFTDNSTKVTEKMIEAAMDVMAPIDDDLLGAGLIAEIYEAMELARRKQVNVPTLDLLEKLRRKPTKIVPDIRNS